MLLTQKTSAESICPEDCPFCETWLKQSPSDFDRVVSESAHTRILPALGMIVPGYFLATPKRHVLSIAELASSEREDLLSSADAFTRLLRKDFPRYLLFEHGSCVTSGSCVEHAHLHVIPSSTEFEDKLHAAAGWAPHASRGDISYLAGQEYMFLRDGQGDFSVVNPGLGSQWIRRLLGEHCGVEGWDWALNSGRENLVVTMKLLGALDD